MPEFAYAQVADEQAAHDSKPCGAEGSGLVVEGGGGHGDGHQRCGSGERGVALVSLVALARLAPKGVPSGTERSSGDELVDLAYREVVIRRGHLLVVGHRDSSNVGGYAIGAKPPICRRFSHALPVHRRAVRNSSATVVTGSVGSGRLARCQEPVSARWLAIPPRIAVIGRVALTMATLDALPPQDDPASMLSRTTSSQTKAARHHLTDKRVPRVRAVRVCDRRPDGVEATARRDRIA